jgi:hypothetical protein
MKKLIFLFLIMPYAILAQSPAPIADHHQHIFSPAMAEFQKIRTITAADVIKDLDEAGIQPAGTRAAE